MLVFLKGFLPRLLPEGYVSNDNVAIRPHEGKQDLQRLLRRRVPQFPYAYREPVRLLVVHDQDANDCLELKRELVDLIDGRHGGELAYCVRIACRELENWYLGSLAAVEEAYPRSKATRLLGKRRYRNVDVLAGAQEMGPVIEIDGNRSPSFRQFTSGLRRLLSR